MKIGDALLVVPALREGQKVVDAYLPKNGPKNSENREQTVVLVWVQFNLSRFGMIQKRTSRMKEEKLIKSTHQ